MQQVWRSFVFHATYSPELLVQFLMEKFLKVMPVIIWHFMLCMGVAVVIHVASAANYASAIILREMHVETTGHMYAVAVVQ
jgi:hypothetical protein